MRALVSGLADPYRHPTVGLPHTPNLDVQMRAGILLSFTALLGACSTAPLSYVSATPRPLEDAYACSLRKLNELGYTVSNTNREAGFISGTKQTSGLGTQILTGSQYHDQLTVSIFDSENGGRQIRATAGRVDRNTSILGTSTTGVAPTPAGIADADALLKACGDGTVTKQGDATLVSTIN